MAGEIIRGFDAEYDRVQAQRPDRCPNCGRDVALELRTQRAVWPKLSNNLVLPAGPCVKELLWSCSYCGLTLLELAIFGEDHPHGSDADPDRVQLVWPERAPRELPPEAPDSVRSLYREASIAEHAGALRGAGALYRAAVEKLCDEQGASGASLYARIDDLATKGIDEDVVADLHEARLLGNWTLHEGVEFSSDEVGDVAELVAAAVHVLYVEPAQRQAMRDARQARRDAQRNA